IILATQIAEASFVAKEGSPLRTLADLKGKKLGMSPAGSATYAIAAAILERNYGLTTSNFTAVPGNEAPLVNFLARGDIDAAAILSRSADLDARDAKSYVELWGQIYMARLEPGDVATLKVMADIFRKSGTVEGVVPASLFNPSPYEQAKR